MKSSSDHSRGGLGPVFRKFKHAALRAVAHVLLPRPEPPFDRNRVRKILVYGTMGIGNIVMLTPTLRALRQGFPNAHITLLAGASNEHIIAVQISSIWTSGLQGDPSLTISILPLVCANPTKLFRTISKRIRGEAP